MNTLGTPDAESPAAPQPHQMVCIGYKCGAKLRAGNPYRHFCPACWMLVPLHLRAMLKGEMDWLRSRGRTAEHDQTSAMLHAAAANRVLEAKLEASPELREQFEKEMLERLTRDGDEPPPAEQPSLIVKP